MEYRIGTVQPSRDEEAVTILDLRKVEHIYAKRRVIVRRGRERKREVVEKPVLPGLMFIPTSVVDDTIQALAEIGMGIRWAKNPARGGNFATCSFTEIVPILDWVRTQEEKFEAMMEQARRKRLAARAAETSEAPQTTVEPEQPARVALPPRKAGSACVVGVGPLAGMDAIVKTDDGLWATVEVGFACIPCKIESCNLQ